MFVTLNLTLLFHVPTLSGHFWYSHLPTYLFSRLLLSIYRPFLPLVEVLDFVRGVTDFSRAFLELLYLPPPPSSSRFSILPSDSQTYP